MATETTIRLVDQLERAGFIVTLEAEQEHIPVRGNAMASGDDEQDRAVEDEIIERLNNGDVWAWASVRVAVSHDDIPSIEGDDYLGGCCYADEADFREPGGYFDDMVRSALDEWIVQVERIGANVDRVLTLANACL